MKLMNVNGETADLFSNLAKTTTVFAKYYSPTCPACIAMNEEWQNMEKEVSRHDAYNGDIIIAQIDPSGMKKLASTTIYSDVQYVPTIVVLENGNKKQEYNEERTADKMISFLLQNDYLVKNNDNNKPMNGGRKIRRTNFSTKNIRNRTKNTCNRTKNTCNHTKNNRKHTKNNRKRTKNNRKRTKNNRKRAKK